MGMFETFEEYDRVEDGLKKSFSTYLNYLSAFRASLKQEYKTKKVLIEKCWENCNTLQGRKDFNTDFVKSRLFLAWNTETISHVITSIEDPGVLRINNHWKPVQAYYSIFNVAEAVTSLLVKRDAKTQQSHQLVLKEVSDFFSKKELIPWGLGVTGCLGKGKSSEVININFPEDCEPAHNLSKSSPKPLLLKCLQAEHKKRVDDKFQDLKKQKKKKQRIYKYKVDPGHTSIFHFLYRLRIKSNYRHSELFLANLSDNDIIEYDDQYNHLVLYSLMALEIPIIKMMGKKAFLEISNNFKAKNNKNELLDERIDLYKKFLK